MTNRWVDLALELNKLDCRTAVGKKRREEIRQEMADALQAEVENRKNKTGESK